jgi:hypothetical protein
VAQYWLIGCYLTIVDLVQQMDRRSQASELGRPRMNVRSPTSHCHNQLCLLKKRIRKKPPLQRNLYINSPNAAPLRLRSVPSGRAMKLDMECGWSIGSSSTYELELSGVILTQELEAGYVGGVKSEDVHLQVTPIS